MTTAITPTVIDEEEENAGCPQCADQNARLEVSMGEMIWGATCSWCKEEQALYDES